MARRTRSSALETRSARLKLADPQKTLLAKARRRLSLGYRRNAGPGTWSLRVANGKGGNWIKAIAPADDYEGTQGALTFWDAQLKAREIARGSAVDDSSKPVTVREALAAYVPDLLARGGGLGNVTWVNYHLTPTLGSKLVAQLNARELRAWRDDLLAKGLAPASVTRVCKSLCAALSLAAAHDPRIQNRDAWRVGLASLPDSSARRAT